MKIEITHSVTPEVTLQTMPNFSVGIADIRGEKVLVFRDDIQFFGLDLYKPLQEIRHWDSQNIRLANFPVELLKPGTKIVLTV